MTKNRLLLLALPTLTNRFLLSKREGDLKSGQCKTILDWLSEDAEVTFGLILQSCHMSLSFRIVRWPPSEPLSQHRGSTWTAARGRKVLGKGLRTRCKYIKRASRFI